MRRRLPAITFLALTASIAIPIPASAQLPSGSDDVTIVDHGAEPRRELRYDWTVDHRERLDSVLTLSIAASEDGRSVMDMQLPISMAINARVTEVQPNGEAWVAMTFDEMVFGPMSVSGEGVPDGAAEAAGFDAAMSQITPLLADVRVWQLMNDRGRVVKTNVQFPPGFPLEAEQQMTQTSGSVALLPEEPVGVGARWDSVGTTVNQGVALTVVSTIELVEMDADEVTLAMTMRLEDDGAGELGAANPFTEISATGSGTYELDLGGIYPRASDVGMMMRMAGDLPNDAGVIVPVVMDLDIDASMGAIEIE